jgi:hypothetical protein
VWQLLTDLDAWPKWGPTVRRAELHGPGPLRLGSRGLVWTPFAVPLPFEITEFEDGRSWAWKVAGVSATGHTVVPQTGGCRVSFSVPVWAPAYLAVGAVALKRIDELTTQ